MVRGVEHLLVGTSAKRPGIHPEHVADCTAMLCKMILKGCQQDLSQFDGIAGVKPVVVLNDGQEVELDMQDTLETWFKPTNVQ